MNTKIITIKEGDCLKEVLREAGDILKAGGVVAFPTETVYGLGADALKTDSANKIYEAKDRPADNPLIIHISRFEDIYAITSQVPESAKRIAEAFWPGPLTMILPKAATVPHETTGGLETVAVRMPSHPVAQTLIELGGGFVAAPSANRSGRPSPTLAKHVTEDMLGRIDMIIDGGAVGIGIESTIIDLTINPPQVLRPGSVTVSMLEEVIGKVAEDNTLLTEDGQAPRAPGMKYRHYAPWGELVIVQGEPDLVTERINREVSKAHAAGEKTGVIGSSQMLAGYRADVVKSVGSREDEEEIAGNLYRILREFDEEKVNRIYSEAFESQGMGQAIMNRLLKAAGHKVITVTEFVPESEKERSKE